MVVSRKLRSPIFYTFSGASANTKPFHQIFTYWQLAFDCIVTIAYFTARRDDKHRFLRLICFIRAFKVGLRFERRGRGPL